MGKRNRTTSRSDIRANTGSDTTEAASSPEVGMTIGSSQSGIPSTPTVCANCEKEDRADRRQEYAQLRAEIIEHGKTELQLIATTVTLVAAGSAFTAQLVKDGNHYEVGSLILSILVGLCTILMSLVEGSTRSIAINAAYLIEFHEKSTGFKWETRLLESRERNKTNEKTSLWYDGTNRLTLIAVLGFVICGFSFLLLFSVFMKFELPGGFCLDQLQHIDLLATLTATAWSATFLWHSIVSYFVQNKVSERGLVKLIPQFIEVWKSAPPAKPTPEGPAGVSSGAEPKSR